MSTHEFRLGFAAILASVSLASAAQAQSEPNASNPPAVTVNYRTGSPFFVAQEPSAKANALDIAPNRQDAQNKDDATAQTPQSDSGRLTPITMESVRAPIGAADISVTDIGTKVLPDDQAVKQMVASRPLPSGRDREFDGLTYRWQAANVCHFPLYFEEPMLERHGQQCCPTWIQPAVSGSKFLSNLVLYPYKATLHPALENRYTLGHFRPGSGAPCLRDTLPWSTDAALVQAGAVTAVAVGLPW